MVLLLAKQIITLYRAVQKTLTKDQHALDIQLVNMCLKGIYMHPDQYLVKTSLIIKKYTSITAYTARSKWFKA